MPKHILSRIVRAGGLEYRKDIEVEADGATERDVVIPASAVDQVVAFVSDVSQLKSLVFLTNRDITVKTNSLGAPANTFSLKADRPFQWVNGDPPLRDTTGAAVTTDITALHVVNPDGSGAAAARLQIFAVEDSTV